MMNYLKDWSDLLKGMGIGIKRRNIGLPTMMTNIMMQLKLFFANKRFC